MEDTETNDRRRKERIKKEVSSIWTRGYAAGVRDRLRVCSAGAGCGHHPIFKYLQYCPSYM